MSFAGLQSFRHSVTLVRVDSSAIAWAFFKSALPDPRRGISSTWRRFSFLGIQSFGNSVSLSARQSSSGATSGREYNTASRSPFCKTAGEWVPHVKIEETVTEILGERHHLAGD